MYHIVTRGKGFFYVVLTGKNYEPLTITESFPTKQSAWKNIRAQIKTFIGNAECYVQDETDRYNIKRYCVGKTGKYLVEGAKSGVMYIPGKNSKKKK